MEKELKLYLIEYSADDIKLIKESLQLSGINCHCVIPESTEKAIDFLLGVNDKNMAEIPDLILLDLKNQEDKNNLQLIKKLKENENVRLIPLIVFTSTSTQDVINEAYFYHANCFVQKPAEPEKYDGALKEIWNFWLETVRLPTAQRRRIKPMTSFN